MTVKSTNIERVQHRVPRAARWAGNGHQSGVLWFTGLSGSGKSTLAFTLEKRLFDEGYQVFVLDGDNIRHGLSADLGFAPEDREENIRRVGETAALFSEAGFIVITAFISPYRRDRAQARKACGNAFHEVHLAADLGVCERRDPKGLYRKARRGEIDQFTGISAPYEAPHRAELVLDTGVLTVAESMQVLLEYVDRVFVREPASRTALG